MGVFVPLSSYRNGWLKGLFPARSVGAFKRFPPLLEPIAQRHVEINIVHGEGDAFEVVRIEKGNQPHS